MKASPVTRGALASLAVRNWAWWQTPWRLRVYVALVPLVALGLACYAASQTTWHVSDLAKFLLLMGCGMVSVAATPRDAFTPGGITRDFLSVWVLPVAILLPLYAMLIPIPLQVVTQFRVYRGIIYRRVFTVAAFAVAYGAASLTFRAFPASFAGPSIGTATHALTWTVAVALCEIIGGRGHHLLILGGMKLTDPAVRIAPLELNREALQGDFAEFDLGVLITVVVAVNAVLAVIAVPTVLLVRRFMMHADSWPSRASTPRPGCSTRRPGSGRRRWRSPGPSARAARWRSRWSTSTTSSWSTTPTATWSGTRRCARSPTRCAAS